MKNINENQWLIGIIILLILATLGAALWQGTQHVTSASVVASANDSAVINEPIQPIPLSIDLNQDKVKLGKRLFNETLLSVDNTKSCVSCHILASGGTDHLRYAVGINGATGTINAPTVYNSGFNFRQFWDGRAPTLQAQVSFPVQNPIEMGSAWDDVVRKLNGATDYAPTFRAIYGNGITADNIADAIATFEMSLYTPNSRFDQYLRGNKSAITADELKGYNLFKTYGCSSCHQGVNVGGNMYQRMGIIVDYFAARGNVIKNDLGLFNITGKEQDRYVFKVPSLRMVALTAPYFHDGSLQTLNEAVKAMAYYQLGRSISDEDISLIVQFLRTLPGENAELTAKP